MYGRLWFYFLFWTKHRIQLVFVNIQSSPPLVTSYFHFSAGEYSGGDLQDFVKRR